MATASGARRQPASSEGVRRVWADVTRRGYAIVRDTELGLDPAIRDHFRGTYFDDGMLEADHQAIHKDRDRARDVVRYEWNGTGLALAEHHTVTIQNRSGYVGPRNHKRVEVLRDPHATEWVHAMLTLVPPRLRQPVGTFGINFFRTRSQVVSGPHRDGEKFCLVYVVDKTGEGAETRLHDLDVVDSIELRHTLVPGEIIIFSDERYLHDVTPLRPAGADSCRRDAIVCTVDNPDTYLC